MTFKPMRDGIDSEVSGVIQVIEEPDGFNVNASYIVGQDSPQPRVYWFDQSEIDTIARSLIEEKQRILIVDDDQECTHLVKILLEKPAVLSCWKRTTLPGLIKVPGIFGRT